VVEHDVARRDLVDDMAGLVGDLYGAVKAAGPLAQKGPADGDGLVARRFCVRQILAGCIAGQGPAFADMKKVTGHEVGFAALFPSVTRERGVRSCNSLWRNWGSLAALAFAPL